MFFHLARNSNVTSQKTCEMLYLKKYRYIQDFSFGKIFERILTMDWGIIDCSLKRVHICFQLEYCTYFYPRRFTTCVFWYVRIKCASFLMFEESFSKKLHSLSTLFYPLQLHFRNSLSNNVFQSVFFPNNYLFDFGRSYTWTLQKICVMSNWWSNYLPSKFYYRSKSQ